MKICMPYILFVVVLSPFSLAPHFAVEFRQSTQFYDVFRVCTIVSVIHGWPS
jgi:hypothetical protein